MHSYNHLFEKLVEHDNILLAINKAAKSKRTNPRVAEVLENPEYFSNCIYDLLTSDNFTIPYHRVYKLEDGVSHKIRYIIKPYYKYEQVIHHMIIQVLEPIIRVGMYRYSCGSIPGRGACYGKKYIIHFIKHNQKDIKYCLQIDIHHFFQSINHDKLKNLISTKIHDKRMVNLLFMIIDAYYDHEENGVKYGLPLGYYTSQWFANWYLEKLDHHIKEDLGVKCDVRYMDDIIMFGSNKKVLHKVREDVDKYLREELDLEINKNWQVFRFEYYNKKLEKNCGKPLDFMGYKFYRDHTELRKHIIYKASRKSRKIKKKDKVTWYDACQMISLLGWFKNTDTYDYYKSYIKPNINVKSLKHKISKKSRRKNK